MKCAVLTSNKKLQIIEREYPVCGPYDVIVAVETCGVCRADRKAFNTGQRDLIMPRVLGHEIVGHVHQIGAKVTDLSIGDRVQVSPGIFCGSCEYCLKGDDHLCNQMRIIGFHLDGGFAQFLHVPWNGCQSTILNKIPSHLDSKSAALTEPLACSLNLQKRLIMSNAQTVVIFGAGPLGLLSAQLAHSLGAERIVIVEPMASRRALAARFSDCQLDFNEHTVSQIAALTHNRGADVVLPCCPGNASLIMALQVTAKRGRIGFFSGLTDEADITNSALNSIHYRELTMVGAYGCSSADNREALAILASGKVNTADMPSADISWSQLPQVLSHLEPYEHIFTYFNPQ